MEWCYVAGLLITRDFEKTAGLLISRDFEKTAYFFITRDFITFLSFTL